MTINETDPLLPESINRLIKLPVYVFAVSLGIGTLLLALHLLLPYHVITITGVLYTLLAIVINLTVCTGLGICAIIYWPYRQIILLRASLLFINIPIAILYICIVFAYPLSFKF